MTSSPRRLLANRANALKSTGPRTPEGKDQSRRNSWKHGLTGEGVALPSEDAAEVEDRFARMVVELGPKTEMGRTLAHRVATMSVRLERCYRHEAARLTLAVDQALREYDRAGAAEPDRPADDPVARDRARQVAADRALFDDSPAAILARKYEAATERSLLRSLRELREVEAAAEANPDPVATCEPLGSSLPAAPGPELGSSSPAMAEVVLGSSLPGVPASPAAPPVPPQEPARRRPNLEKLRKQAARAGRRAG